MSRSWHLATLRARSVETSSASTLRFDIPDWPGHVAGQHLDVRLTAPDGYTASRSYSLASAPGRGPVEITVQRVEDGEVSSYLHDVLPIGAAVEVSPPRGGFFVWRGDSARPVLLVGGGSGVVPLMSMLRTRLQLPAGSPGASAPLHLVYSTRTPDDVLYAGELARISTAPGVRISYAFTRSGPAGATVGRLGTGRSAELAEPGPGLAPDAYVCGPNGFVEAVASTLVDLGHDPQRIRTERFGPTG